MRSGLIALFCLFLACHARPPQGVILISIDGMRWDYLDHYKPPVLQELTREGVRIRQLIPSFPSKTFPNHYSLATGLRAENHGIVGNDFSEPSTGRIFHMSNPADNRDPHWWRGEPIWITAERQGVKAANLFWVGAEVVRPSGPPRSTYLIPYQERKPSLERVGQVLNWLDLPENQRPRFLTLYFSIVDTAGHRHGPLSKGVARALDEVDQALGVLRIGLQQRALDSLFNLVVVSDHGMAEVSEERVVLLDEVLRPGDPSPEWTGPLSGFRAPAESVDDLMARLRTLPHLRVFHKNDLPARYGFTRGERIPEILVFADEGWLIATRTLWEKRYTQLPRGDHGFDCNYGSMAATFLAKGPAFKKAFEIPSADNIHLYPLLCALLGIQPAPNDGDDRLIRQLLLP